MPTDNIHVLLLHWNPATSRSVQCALMIIQKWLAFYWDTLYSTVIVFAALSLLLRSRMNERMKAGRKTLSVCRDDGREPDIYPAGCRRLL